MQLIFATGNQGKLSEVRKILNLPNLNVMSLKDINYSIDIKETGTTLSENALIKTRTIVNETDYINVFSEDTGLEVTCLDMAPGVYTARYGGPQKDNQINMNTLLTNMSKYSDRSAQFRTVIALSISGEEHLFEGIITGTIARKPIGKNGFGYDPIFIPKGYSETFAQLSDEIKNKISHRARAMNKLMDYLDKTLG